jgi:hypothetical protein
MRVMRVAKIGPCAVIRGIALRVPVLTLTGLSTRGTSRARSPLPLAAVVYSGPTEVQQSSSEWASSPHNESPGRCLPVDWPSNNRCGVLGGWP